MKDYKEYIMKHRQGVIDTWNNVLKPVVMKDVPEEIIEDIDLLVVDHDLSKLRSMIEYLPYSNHYNDPENYPKSSEQYKRGWNHHQKQNPHHWQYWVVLEDIEDPKIYALEMDFEYVIEMLCDWQSASDYYGNTAHWWYETQKDNMILHPKTRASVEKYLEYLN